MTRKRKEEPDDLTFDAMAVEEPARARKKVATPRPDPWQAVADECPCAAPIEPHRAPRDGVVRVHVTALEHPVLCVPGTWHESRYVPAAMPPVRYGISESWGELWTNWRITDAYAHAELLR